MRRRRRNSAQGTRKSESFQFRPFQALRGRQVKSVPPVEEVPLPAPPVPEPLVQETDEELFCREMRGVKVLPAIARTRVPEIGPARGGSWVRAGKDEGLAELAELVSGGGCFDITDTTDYVEGCAEGVDPRLVRRLRAGDFARQKHLDLHGLSVEQARVAVDRFLLDAYRGGSRCILIVHGRGLNSPGQVPVLKTWLCGWLARGPGARLVLAFTTARACDGGAGAMYVLLRRQRGHKHPIRVTHGAKI